MSDCPYGDIFFCAVLRLHLRTPILPLAVGVLAASVLGCSFHRLAKNEAEGERSFLVLGELSDVSGADAEVRVFMETDDGLEPHATDEIDGSSSFGFVLDSGGTYRVLTWVDEDDDGELDASERWDDLVLGADIPKGQIERIELRPKASTVPPEIIDALYLDSSRTQELGIEFVAGEIADLDEHKFSSEVGELGMWRALDFARESDVGVFFLTEFDPDKTPVLYVNGISGSVQDWRYHLDHLDTTRYQAWFFQYPSALRIDSAGELLDDRVTVLHERHRFERLIVVAHSMGGLVSRAFLLRAEERERPYRRALITFSTPWGGHKQASMGVKYAPEVVPSWIDMAPGSDFLLRVSETELAAPHVLFFGYNWGAFPPGTNNDGVVTMPSQLARWAQEDARHIEGFHESHVGILSSEEAYRVFRRTLDELDDELAGR